MGTRAHRLYMHSYAQTDGIVHLSLASRKHITKTFCSHNFCTLEEKLFLAVWVTLQAIEVKLLLQCFTFVY